MIAVLHVVAGVLFAAASLAALVRVVRGPTILDRMLASDVLLTVLLLLVGVEMVVNRHTGNIPIMIVIAGVGAFSTVAVARYVSQQDGRSADAGPAPTVATGEDADERR